MKKTILLAATLSLIACSKEKSTGIVRDTGAIASDGCGWVIEISGEYFTPKNLDNKYQVNNLTVEIEYKELDSKTNCGLKPEGLTDIKIFEIN